MARRTPRYNHRVKVQLGYLAILFLIAGACGNFTLQFDFRTLSYLCIPLMLFQFAWANLLYGRSRAFSRGSFRVRTVVAAEVALSGALTTLGAIVVSAFLYWALTVLFGYPRAGPPPTDWRGNLIWLFVPVDAAVGFGFVCFLQSAAMVSKPLSRSGFSSLVRQVRNGVK